MIRNDSEYQEALRRLNGGIKAVAEYRARLEAEGLLPEEVEYALGPTVSTALEVREEVAHYERTKQGDLARIVNLHGLGPLLVAARVAASVTQRQLAERLEVHESQVSRDERNEYHGVTVERASKILDALAVTLTSAFERKPPQPLGTVTPVPYPTARSLSTGARDGAASGPKPRAPLEPFNDGAASGPKPRAPSEPFNDGAASGPKPRAPSEPSRPDAPGATVVKRKKKPPRAPAGR
jgi:transcriptional regulator with XRE-family HTH domain